MSSVIEEAVGLARVPSPNVEALKEEKEELLRHRERLLPVEAALKKHIESRATEIDYAIQSYLSAHEYREGGEPLPMLALDVLRWRHDPKLGWGPPSMLRLPKLALVNVQDGGMTISVKDGPGVLSGRPVAPALRSCFRDVIDDMSALLGRNRSAVAVEFTYNGAIPSDIRDLIRKEQSHFDEIYLLVDAPREAWVYREQKKTIRKRLADAVADPLVVGWRGVGLYLLGQFDPTPIEAYAAAEFTHRPALGTGK